MPTSEETHQMRAEIHEIAAAVNKLVGWQDRQNDNITRFWQHDWPALQQSVAASAARLTALEREVHSTNGHIVTLQTTMKDHEARLREVEKGGLKLAAQAALVAALAGMAVPFILKLLFTH